MLNRAILLEMAADPVVSYLLAAGGGGGGGVVSGSSGQPGGGGAGGLLLGSAELRAGSYPVVIGTGGAAGSAGGNAGGNGTNTTFNALTAIGGGGGGFPNSVNSAKSGGSGGGGANMSSGSSTPGLGTVGQGFDGTAGSGTFGCGGGGGAGGSGPTNSSFGGPGVASTISGSSTTYCEGGRGQWLVVDGPPPVGPGWGGYGTSDQTVHPAGYPGSNGIVIVRYPGSPRATGGTITSAGGYTVHTFTSSGTLAVIR